MTACTNEFRAVVVTLSDGSQAHNVTGTVDRGAAGQQTLTLGCEDRETALAMADLLNRTAWIEVDAQDYEAPEGRRPAMRSYPRPMDIAEAEDREADAPDRPAEDPCAYRQRGLECRNAPINKPGSCGCRRTATDEGPRGAWVDGDIEGSRTVEDYDDEPDEPEDNCAHEWNYTGTNYGGDDERWHGEGRVICRLCGADGDA